MKPIQFTALLLGLLGTARADVLVYESFGDVATDFSSIAGYETTTADLAAGLGGPWSLEEGAAQHFRINDDWALDSPPNGYLIEEANGSNHYWEETGGYAVQRAQAPLAESIDMSSDGTWYISFFYRGANVDSVWQVGLNDGTDELMVGHGYNAGASGSQGVGAFYQDVGGTAVGTSGINPVHGAWAVQLMVAKLVKSDSGNTDQLEVSLKSYDYENANVDLTDPTSWLYTETITGVDNVFTNLQLKIAAGGGAYAGVDEIRIGESWADATGVSGEPAAPVIGTEPAETTDGDIDGSVQITVGATGNPAPTYQWQESTDGGSTWTDLSDGAHPDGATISGAATAALTLSDLAFAMDTYQYRVVVTNSEGEATSAASTLSVIYPAPTFDLQPVSLEDVLAGDPVSFEVSASGSGNLSYQWQYSADGANTWTDLADGGSISGATTDLLTIDPTAHADAGLYRCMVSDDASVADTGSETSGPSNWAYLALSDDVEGGFEWVDDGAVDSDISYDGAGGDSGIDPYTQVGNDIGFGYVAGDTDTLTVDGGTLTLLNKDQWAPKIGRNGGMGTVTINSGTLNIVDTGAGGSAANNEQRFSVGASATGTLTLDGGDVNLHIGPGTDAERGFYVATGGDTSSGTVNLDAGTLTYHSDAPVQIGNGTASGEINIVNGHLRITGTEEVTVGSTGVIDFATGGTGSIAILGWGSSDAGFYDEYSRLKDLIDFGMVTINGVSVTPGDFEPFSFSEDNGMGVLELSNSELLAPVVESPPEDASGFLDGSVEFAATISGNPLPNMQWQVSEDGGSTWTDLADGDDVSGAITDTLELSNLTISMDGNMYRLTGTNSEGSATSDPATLSVSYPDPTITDQPESIDQTVAAGESASFTVAATGIGTLTYQWEMSLDGGNTWTNVTNDDGISGATTATLAFDPVAHVDAGLYRCVVRDDAAVADTGSPTTSTSNWAYLALLNDSTNFVFDPNSVQSYDGAGLDSGINPYTQVGDDIAFGFDAGQSGELTVTSGELTLLNKDQWAPQLGRAGGATGMITVQAEAILNIVDTGEGGNGETTNQRFAIGGNGSGTFTVDGGEVNIHTGPGPNPARGFIMAQGEAATGTLNLNDGVFTYHSDGTVAIHADGASATVNVEDGDLRVTNTEDVVVGANGTLNFATGGTGSVAILGWGSSDNDFRAEGYDRFKDLIDFGNVTIDGVPVDVEDYSPFIFSDEGGLGVMTIDPNYELAGFSQWATDNVGGQGPDEDFDNDGIQNGIEYFFDAAAGFTVNPQPVDGTVTWTNGGNIPASGYATQFVVQTSANLVDWDDVLAGDPNLVNEDGSVSYTLPAGPEPLFVRLVVTPN